MGLTEEVADFSRPLMARVQGQAKTGDISPLNLMYRVDGTTDLNEEVLQHCRGLPRFVPGSDRHGAAEQLQLDMHGEALDSIYYGDQRGLQLGHRGWAAVSGLLTWLAGHWDQPWLPRLAS
jgi:GH15 family glucan-1,4-alpha-glucosidase